MEKRALNIYYLSYDISNDTCRKGFIKALYETLNIISEEGVFKNFNSNNTDNMDNTDNTDEYYIVKPSATAVIFYSHLDVDTISSKIVNYDTDIRFGISKIDSKDIIICTLDNLDLHENAAAEIRQLVDNFQEKQQDDLYTRMESIGQQNGTTVKYFKVLSN